MSLTHQVIQKLHSPNYKLRARGFKRSQACRSHRHNKPLVSTDWQAVQDGVAAVCHTRGVGFDDLKTDMDDYTRFKRDFKLSPLSLYALRCRKKKFMEHYIAFRSIYSPATLKRILIDDSGLRYRVFRIAGLNAIAEAEAISQHELSMLRRVRYALLIEKTTNQPASQ